MTAYTKEPMKLATVRKVGWIRWAVVIEGIIIRKDWSKDMADFAAKFINDAVSEEIAYHAFLRNVGEREYAC